ncbi:hypothetical protein KSD_06830 [Ktedonobacter sp. SOSP1-85]|nr:hypothetical protein KSD_06830 [Ktedonobacter sp. SOSP1-85]
MWELVFIPLTHLHSGRSGTFAPSLNGSSERKGSPTPRQEGDPPAPPLHRAALLISVISL